MTDLYRLREHFLSAPEAAFYNVLSDVLRDQLVGELLIVCPKIALSDLVTVSRPNENIHQLNRLHRKTVDFLLVHRATLAPALAIELDYPKQTHHRTDTFLEDVFASAHLPFVRITVKETYDQNRIAVFIKNALASQNYAEKSRTEQDFSPVCPRCGITMVLRFQKMGNVVTQKYYGCLNFPECTETIPV